MSYAAAVAITPIVVPSLTPISIATLTAADATNGNKFTANRNTLFRVKNGSGGSITVTLHVNYTLKGLVVPDLAFAVAAAGDVIFSDFSSLFDENTGDADFDVWVTFSAVTTVTIQAINPLSS